MSDHFVIGTAGHVDHGKTALVKVLTGVDTDRWEEEKRRGITIDLGFARLDLGDGRAASIVDVPGHEDFIRNMVAGATGVDVALLVVAADEGLMPQTLEHISILEFLGVKSGVAAVTKCDLVAADWLELVKSDLEDRLRESEIQWEDPVAVSSIEGIGLDELLAAIRDAGKNTVERSRGDLFRMPVDRVFSVAGAGTVATGTVWSGSIGAGEDVLIFPGNRRARVRSIEVHGEAASTAIPGRRTALALTGLDRTALRRGSVVVSDDCWKESRVVDVMVSLLPEARALSQRSRVRIHLGTAEIIARVTPAHGDIKPGDREAARLRLEEPAVVRCGDRGVIRSYSPITTIGGIVVVDPWPPARPRRPVDAASKYRRNSRERLSAFVTAARAGVAVGELAVRLGFDPDTERELTKSPPEGVELLDSIFVSSPDVKQVTDTALDRLHLYHETHPLVPGMDLEEFRRLVGFGSAGTSVVERLRSSGRVVVDKGSVRLEGFRPRLSAAQAKMADDVLNALSTAGYQGLSGPELARLLPQDEESGFTDFLVRGGSVVRVGEGRYYSRPVLEEISSKVAEEVQRRGQASPAELKELLGVTRKYLIPLLEWLDAKGVTVRKGDVRTAGPRASEVGGKRG